MLQVNIEKIIPVTEARDMFNKIIDDVEGTDELWVLTKNGRPVAVVVGVNHLEKLTGESHSDVIAKIDNVPLDIVADDNENVTDALEPENVEEPQSVFASADDAVPTSVTQPAVDITDDLPITETTGEVSEPLAAPATTDQTATELATPDTMPVAPDSPGLNPIAPDTQPASSPLFDSTTPIDENSNGSSPDSAISTDPFAQPATPPETLAHSDTDQDADNGPTLPPRQDY